MDEYIDIEKDLIPYRFDIDLGGVLFTFEVNYNAEEDFFTLDMERDGERLATDKIVYGVPLFADFAGDERFPDVTIVPLDTSGSSSTVNYETLSSTVFLYVGDANE